MCVKMAIQSKGKRLIFNVSSIPKWDQLLKKRIHYSRSEFFSLRIDPILDSGQQRKIPQLFPCVKMAEKNVVHQCTVVSFLQNWAASQYQSTRAQSNKQANTCFNVYGYTSTFLRYFYKGEWHLFISGLDDEKKAV